MKYVITIAVTTLSILTAQLWACDERSALRKEILNLATSINVDDQPLPSVVRRLSKKVQSGLPLGSSSTFEIRVMATDLKQEGFTVNQAIRDFIVRDQPLRKVLTGLVVKANGNRSAETASESKQRLVWVVSQDPELSEENLVILITTREGAAMRGCTLPDEFMRNVQSR